MSRADLSAFGERWNKKAKAEVAFDPRDAGLDRGVVSTGLETVDAILGGGLPRGRIVMFYGAESAGKTLLAQLAMAAAQRTGGRAIYMDIERTFTPRWFELTGVSLDPDKLLILRPRSLEQGFDMIVDALDTVRPDILVVDSVAAMVPQAVMDASMEAQDFMALTARKITEGVKKANQYNHSTVLILINQLRVKVGALKYENPNSYPGGKALRHMCTQVIYLRRGGWLTRASEAKSGDLLDQAQAVLDDTSGDATRIGFEMKVRVEKNKYDVPWREAEVKVFFNGVVDEISALVGNLIQQGIVKRYGGYYEVPGVEGKLHGWEKLEELIRGDDALRARLRGMMLR